MARWTTPEPRPVPELIRRESGSFRADIGGLLGASRAGSTLARMNGLVFQLCVLTVAGRMVREPDR
jgi:uncharacterized membrane protein (UPF0136 family)